MMPFVEGGTLRDRLARPPIPSLAEALSLTRQVAAGLTYAHQHGVVHRDIKPANILLASGHAFIADFGIARAVRQKMTEEQLTATGLAVGTPAYMAPEQNVTSTVDGRADEYALACVLHRDVARLPAVAPRRPHFRFVARSEPVGPTCRLRLRQRWSEPCLWTPRSGSPMSRSLRRHSKDPSPLQDPASHLERRSFALPRWRL
mgnify:CR=1 FL=1